MWTALKVLGILVLGFFILMGLAPWVPVLEDAISDSLANIHFVWNWGRLLEIAAALFLCGTISGWWKTRKKK
ncbi:MAG: hypothetical protein ABSC55_24310 [Syntrophorhabdales bacterium]|jgi:hypothetical protein